MQITMFVSDAILKVQNILFSTNVFYSSTNNIRHRDGDRLIYRHNVSIYKRNCYLVWLQ